MKVIILYISLLLISLSSFSQEVYTAKKGSRLFPGHAHVIITVDTANIHYELFNHWYVWSYAQYRDITVSRNDLEAFNTNNDTLNLTITSNKVKLVDKKYRLKKKVKHQKLCASTTTMRKISYACEITAKTDIRHFELYDNEDLSLSEEEFEELVDSRIILRLDSCNNINTYR